MQRQVQGYAAITRTANVLGSGQVLLQSAVDDAEGTALGVTSLTQTARIAAMHRLSIHRARQPHRCPRWQTVHSFVVEGAPGVANLAGVAEDAMAARRIQGKSVLAQRAGPTHPVINGTAPPWRQ